jgi:acetoin utilization deacetylase AcuC-like enzyme
VAQIKSATTTNPIIIHDDSYNNWNLTVTRGRRFINGLSQLQNHFGDKLSIVAPRLATVEELTLVHELNYVEEVTEDWITDEWDTQNEELALLAQTFAGGTLVALDALLNGETLTAIHLPGAKHHAQYDHSSGFCVFADFAMAAKIAVSKGLKVAILDVDAHHGDGTENLCAEDPNIMTFSVHQFGIFPGTGILEIPEKLVFNEGLAAGNGDVELLAAVERFNGLAIDFAPDLIFVAAGADGHREDPLSRLNYEAEGFHAAMSKVRESFPSLPILMGGAGGYDPDNYTPQMWLSAADGLVSGSVVR